MTERERNKERQCFTYVTTMRLSLSPISIAYRGALTILYTDQTDTEHLLLMKRQNGVSTLKDNLEVSYKTNHTLIV